MSGRIIREGGPAGIAGLPKIGKVTVGMKSERGYPMSIDYFRPTGKYAELFTKILGAKPTSIPVIFPSDDPALVCNEQYEYRDNAGALVAYGDGQTFYVWDGAKYAPFTIERIPDLMARVAAKYPKKPRKEGDDGWDITLEMWFIIPALREVVGVWGFKTKGAASSIRNIRDSFDAVQSLRGTVRTSAFDLSVKMHKSNKPGSNSRYPVVNLVCDDTLVPSIQAVLEQRGGVLQIGEK